MEVVKIRSVARHSCGVWGGVQRASTSVGRSEGWKERLWLLQVQVQRHLRQVPELKVATPRSGYDL